MLSLVVCWRSSSRETILVDMIDKLLRGRGATGEDAEFLRCLIMARLFASLVPTDSNTPLRTIISSSWK